MTDSGRGIVQMENGPLAEVTFNPDGTFQVERILRKASGLSSPSRDEMVKEVGALIAEMPVGEDGCARVELT